MAGVSKLKIVAALIAIVSVIIIPVYAAYNEQNKSTVSGQEEIVAFEIDPEEEEEIQEGEEQGSDEIFEDEDEKPLQTGFSIPKPSPTPRVGYSVIDSVEIKAPKWVPDNPATDQKLLRDNMVEEGTTNILIMGRDRNWLDDTMGIVNIDTEKKLIKLIMFPRDTYIEYSEDVMAAVKKTRMERQAGWFKLNNIYKVGTTTEKFLDVTYNNNKFKERGYDFLCQVLYEKFDIVVDEYVRINNYGFVKIVDLFKGVTVYVPTRMRYSDPLQGLNIDLQKGTQHLNGAQAEGFVRFRQGYDANGEINVYSDRTKNQIAFLKAFYEQHGKLSNVTKIPELISLLKKNVEHSFGVGEILTTYMELLSEIVSEEYTLKTYTIAYREKRINGTSHAIIEYKSGLDE